MAYLSGTEADRVVQLLLFVLISIFTEVMRKSSYFPSFLSLFLSLSTVYLVTLSSVIYSCF